MIIWGRGDGSVRGSSLSTLHDPLLTVMAEQVKTAAWITQVLPQDLREKETRH